MRRKLVAPLGLVLSLVPVPAAATAADTCSVTASPAASIGTWPPSCWRPYSDTSAFNLPLPASVPKPGASELDASSPSVLAAQQNPPAGERPDPDPHPSPLQIDDWGIIGWPTYYVGAGDSTYTTATIRCTPGGACDSPAGTVRVPFQLQAGTGQPLFPNIQTGAVAANPATGVGCKTATIAASPVGDCHLTIVDTASGIEHDFWKVHTTTGLADPTQSGGELRVDGAGHERIDGDGRTEGLGDANAAKVGNLAGRLRAEEVEAALRFEQTQGQDGRPIAHALAITVPCLSSARGPLFRYPAGKANTGARNCPGTAGPLMGTRLRVAIPSNADLAKLTPWQAAIVRAAASYGFIVMDIGSQYAMSLQLESGHQYRFGQPAADTLQPWRALVTNASGWQRVSSDCDSWTGLDTGNQDCLHVGRLGGPRVSPEQQAILQSVWRSLSVVAECASFPASDQRSCGRAAAQLTLSDSAPVAGSTVHVSGGNYTPGTRVRVCQTASTSAACKTAGVVVDVQPDGTIAASLQVTPTAAGADCSVAGACRILVPDLVWDRQTGSHPAVAALTVRIGQSAPEFTLASPPAAAREGSVYDYRFAASGSPVYALSGAPLWLTINSSTGRVTGTPPTGTGGRPFTFSVTATNAAGMATAGPFTVAVTPRDWLPDRVAAGTTISKRGSLQTLVTQFARLMPGRASGLYVDPTSAERQVLEHGVREVLANRVTQAARTLAPLDYRLIRWTDTATGRRLVVLVQTSTAWQQRRAWGLYVLDRGGRSTAIEAPHPVADLRTEVLAVALQRRVRARALMIAGAHRAAVAGDAADVAHQAASAFHAVHAELLRSGIARFLQVHGFDGSASSRTFDAVVSTGSAKDSSLVRGLARELRRSKIKTCVYNGRQCRGLGGTTNVQGRATRAARRQFVHLELALAVRDSASQRRHVERAVSVSGV